MYSILVILSCLVGLGSCLYSPTDDVVELTTSNFNNRVLGSPDLWLVEFYAPWCGHCKNLVPEWKKAATYLKGIVNIGGVDMTAHKSVGAPYNVRGFPTIKIFGSNKAKPEDYNGARTANAIVDVALNNLRALVNDRMSGKSGSTGSGSDEKKSSDGGDGDANDVVELTDANFAELVLGSTDMWLVEFFAPWCGHCKNLAPHWQSAAAELKGKVKLGAMDATLNTFTPSKYGVRGYPTIKLFPAGKKDGEASAYDGGRTTASIISWALDKLAENTPPPDIIELTDAAVLKEACEEHKLCVVSILPNILDCQAECRNDYLQLLKLLGEKHKKHQWGWVWAEAGSQPEVEQTLNIGGFGYPAMAAINARKMKFALLKGPFSEKGINEFLLEASAGRSATDSMRNNKLPTVAQTAPWDGKDAPPPAEYDADEESEEKKEEL